MNSKSADELDLLAQLRLVQEENQQLRNELASLSKTTELVQSTTGYNADTSLQELNLIYQVMNFGNFTWWKMELPAGNIKFGRKKTDMLGYDAANFNNYKDFTNLLHPDDFKQAVQAMQDHLKGLKDFYHTEYRIKNAQGEYLWFEDMGMIVEKDSENQKYSLIGYVVDITGRKQAESALRKQTKETENYLHIIPDLLARCKNDGFINLRNQAWAEHLGYQENERINLFSILHPDEGERLRSIIGELKPEQSIKGIINRVFKKEGSTIIIEWHIKKLENEYLVAGRDISERYQTELNLKESIKRFDQIATLNGEIIWEIDNNGLYTYISHACEQVLGYKAEEIIGKLHFYDLIHLSARDEMKKNAFEMMAKKEPFVNFENNVLDKSGNEVWLLTNGSPVYNTEYQIIGYRGSDRDISEYRAIMIALAESEKRYKALAESSNAGIGLVDKNEVFIFANDAIARMLGYEKSEILGHSLEEFAAAETFEFFVDKTTNRAPGFSDQYETSMVHKSGEIRIFSVSASSLTDNNNNLVGTIGVLIDITDKKQNEALLVDRNQQLAELNDQLSNQYDQLKMANSALESARTKAEASDRLKTIFLNNISHEIRTPLNGIYGVSQIILQILEQNEQMEDLGSILQQSTDRLINTIDDIVDASMFMSGNVQPVYSGCDIKELVNELASGFENDANKKGIKLFFNVDPILEITKPIIDSKLTSRILEELIDNSIKYTNTGNIEVDVKAAHDHLAIKVSDSGTGIPDNVIPLIFKPFSQADGSSTRIKEGNGLGLYIVKEAVKLLDGHVKVESSTDEGTIFHIKLPSINILKQKDPTTDPELNNEKASTPVILVAEDEELNLKYILRLLSDRNCHVLTACNGIEAIDQTEHHPEISIILMDLKMPEMNGFEASGIIKKKHPHIKIAAVTAFASAEDQHKAISSGCDDVVIKPFKAEELYNLIYKLTGNQV